jgi:hypothetical protein
MIDLAMVNWEKVRHPSPLFNVFSDPEPGEIGEIVKRLKDDYLYAPDELRDENVLLQLVGSYWTGPNIIYEVAEFRGILGFLDILPEHKANVTLKLWGKETWGRNFVREAKALLALIMDEFGLTRLATETPDPRVAVMARLAGFEIEGTRIKDFKWNGDYYDTTIMGLVRE